MLRLSRPLFLLALVFLGFELFAENRHSYYPRDFQAQIHEGLKDAPLKERLFAILSQGHVQSAAGDSLVASCAGSENCIEPKSLGYTEARRIMFGQIFLQHTKQGYSVRDVYCQVDYFESDFVKLPPGPGRIPDNEILNTEHSWPQSKFSGQFPTDMQKSDLHILFPVSKVANSTRSNFQMAEVDEVRSAPCPASKLGLHRDGGRTNYFEPPDEQKGATARAIFYFSIRYKLPIQPLEESHLRKWHREYPVTPFERDRNEQIFQAQQNRNPFVDDPVLVDRISDF